MTGTDTSHAMKEQRGAARPQKGGAEAKVSHAKKHTGAASPAVHSSLFTPSIWAIGIALGCTLAWPLMAFQSMGLFMGLEHPEATLDQTYLLSIAATALTLAACGIFSKQAGRMLRSTIARVVVPAGVAASTLLLLGANAPGGAGATLIVLFGVLSGVFTALFLMNFGAVITLLPLKQTVAATAIGYLVSSGLFFVFLFFAWFEAVVCAASMVPIAAVCLYFATSSPHFDADEPLPEQKRPTDHTERRDLATLVGAFSLCMLITGAAYELSRTLYVQMGQFASAGNVAPYSIAQGGVSTLTVLGSIAAAVALISSRGVRGPELCYRLIIFFLMLGVLLLPAPLLFNGLPAYVPLAVNVGSFQCLGMVMWILLSGICRRWPANSLRAFAFVRCAWAVGPLAGMLLGRWVWYSVGFSVQGAFIASVVCAALITLVSTFIFTESMLARALNIMPLERKRRFQERCRRVIERYGLTEREGEIMVMFAKGRNLPYVQEELCLSKSTVSTHRQHIYQKLGVHSGQEMIDLIQDEK